MDKLEEIRKSSLRSAIVSSVGIGIFIFSLVFASYNLFNANKTLKSLNDSVTLKKSQLIVLKKTIAKTQYQLDTITIKKANYENKINDLIKIGKQHENGTTNPAITKAINSAENSLLSVSLYGYQVDPKSFNLVRNSLINAGYSVIKSQILTDRTPWLSSKSAVLYYDDKLADRAKALSLLLATETGVPFDCTTGRGLGVIKGQEQTTLKIHYIYSPNNTPPNNSKSTTTSSQPQESDKTQTVAPQQPLTQTPTYDWRQVEDSTKYITKNYGQTWYKNFDITVNSLSSRQETANVTFFMVSNGSYTQFENDTDIDANKTLSVYSPDGAFRYDITMVKFGKIGLKTSAYFRVVTYKKTLKS